MTWTSQFHDGDHVRRPGQTEPIINVPVVSGVMIFPDHVNNIVLCLGASILKTNIKNFDYVPITKVASKRVFNILVILLLYRTAVL